MCATPIEIKGWASGIYLHTEDANEGGGYRILGGGNGLNENSEWEGTTFDFSETAAMKGESNLEDAYDSKPEFNSVTTELNYLSVKVQVGSQYWSVIVPFYSQPVEQNAIVQSCQYDEFYLANLAQNANLLAGLEFERGDFLFCIKSTQAECKLSDYRFFDTNDETFVSTRPNAPRISDFIADAEAGCAPAVNPGSGPELDWGRFELKSQLTTSVKLYADFAFGESSRNPDSEAAASGLPPYKTYYYEVNGAAQTGNSLNVTFEFNSDNMIYFDGLADSSELSNATDAEVATKLTFSSLHQTTADPNGSDTTPVLRATPTLTLSNKTTGELQSARD
jgi:hypothetical protein